MSRIITSTALLLLLALSPIAHAQDEEDGTAYPETSVTGGIFHYGYLSAYQELTFSSLGLKLQAFPDRANTCEGKLNWRELTRYAAGDDNDLLALSFDACTEDKALVCLNHDEALRDEPGNANCASISTVYEWDESEDEETLPISLSHYDGEVSFAIEIGGDIRFSNDSGMELGLARNAEDEDGEPYAQCEAAEDNLYVDFVAFLASAESINLTLAPCEDKPDQTLICAAEADAFICISRRTEYHLYDRTDETDGMP